VVMIVSACGHDCECVMVVSACVMVMIVSACGHDCECVW